MIGMVIKIKHKLHRKRIIFVSPTHCSFDDISKRQIPAIVCSYKSVIRMCIDVIVKQHVFVFKNQASKNPINWKKKKH